MVVEGKGMKGKAEVKNCCFDTVSHFEIGISNIMIAITLL